MHARTLVGCGHAVMATLSTALTGFFLHGLMASLRRFLPERRVRQGVAVPPMPMMDIIVYGIRRDTICLYTIRRCLRWQHRDRCILIRKTKAGPQQGYE